MDSLARAVKQDLHALRKAMRKKHQHRERIGVDTLSYRFANGLDLWTGEPLGKNYSTTNIAEKD